jgi:hypothetical protein
LKNVKNQDAHFKGSEMETPTLRSQKSFFQKRRNRRPVTLQICRHAATSVCRPCRSWARALRTIRNGRRNTNATPNFRVSLRRDGNGKNVDATPETLKHMGVAALRVFLEGNWKLFSRNYYELPAHNKECVSF